MRSNVLKIFNLTPKYGEKFSNLHKISIIFLSPKYDFSKKVACTFLLHCIAYNTISLVFVYFNLVIEHWNRCMKALTIRVFWMSLGNTDCSLKIFFPNVKKAKKICSSYARSLILKRNHDLVSFEEIPLPFVWREELSVSCNYYEKRGHEWRGM